MKVSTRILALDLCEDLKPSKQFLQFLIHTSQIGLKRNNHTRMVQSKKLNDERRQDGRREGEANVFNFVSGGNVKTFKFD